MQLLKMFIQYIHKEFTSEIEEYIRLGATTVQGLR